MDPRRATAAARRGGPRRPHPDAAGAQQRCHDAARPGPSRPGTPDDQAASGALAPGRPRHGRRGLRGRTFRTPGRGSVHRPAARRAALRRCVPAEPASDHTDVGAGRQPTPLAHALAPAPRRGPAGHGLHLLGGRPPYRDRSDAVRSAGHRAPGHLRDGDPAGPADRDRHRDRNRGRHRDICRREHHPLPGAYHPGRHRRGRRGAGRPGTVSRRPAAPAAAPGGGHPGHHPDLVDRQRRPGIPPRPGRPHPGLRRQRTPGALVHRDPAESRHQPVVEVAPVPRRHLPDAVVRRQGRSAHRRHDRRRRTRAAAAAGPGAPHRGGGHPDADLRPAVAPRPAPAHRGACRPDRFRPRRAVRPAPRGRPRRSLVRRDRHRGLHHLRAAGRATGGDERIRRRRPRHRNGQSASCTTMRANAP